MRIVIIGGGQTGAHLAETLSPDGHDVVLIDSSAEVLAELDAHLDLMTIQGDGANPETLEKADLERADLGVAVTGRDDTNFLACIFARQRGGGADGGAGVVLGLHHQPAPRFSGAGGGFAGEPVR